MEDILEFIKQLRFNRDINIKKGLINIINLDYVIERLEDCLNVEVLELLDVELEDDETVEGGISFMGETLRDFMFELNIPYNISLEDLNKELKDCGIKPLKVKE